MDKSKQTITGNRPGTTSKLTVATDDTFDISPFSPFASPSRPPSSLRSSSAMASPRVQSLKPRDIQSAGKIYSSNFDDHFKSRAAVTAPADLSNMLRQFSTSPEKKKSLKSKLISSPAGNTATVTFESDFVNTSKQNNPDAESSQISAGNGDYESSQFANLRQKPPSRFDNTFIDDDSVYDMSDYTTEQIISFIATTDLDANMPHFLYVTPRFNLEVLSKYNFYDLVILDKPGNSNSGRVWKPKYDALNSGIHLRLIAHVSNVYFYLHEYFVS